jgi:RNA polymerase sigma factor (sigma-70 family)
MASAIAQAVLATRPSALPGFTTTELRIVPPLTVAVRRRGGDEGLQVPAFGLASPHWSRRGRIKTARRSRFRGEDGMGSTEKPAFAQVVEEHGSFIRRTLSQLGVSARALDDIEQEVRRGIDRGLSTFDPEMAANPASAMRGWLFGICERQAANHRRSENRRGEVLQADDDMAHVRSSAPTAEESLMEAERKDLLHELLATLEPRRRAVIIAYELEGISMPDVAAGLSVPVNTAWNLRRLARDDLRAAYSRVDAQERGGLVRRGMQWARNP